MHENRNHSIAGLFVYLLLAVFAVMSLALVLLGIRTYSSAAEKTRTHNTERILTSYARTLLRGADRENAVYTEEINGLPVLTVLTLEGEETYITRLYAHEGHLCEQFTEAETGFDPEYGEALTECASFTPEIRDGLVSLRFTETDGTEQTVYVALKAGR